MLQKVITVSNGAKSGKPINFNYIMEASNVEQERLKLIFKNIALESFWSTEIWKTSIFETKYEFRKDTRKNIKIKPKLQFLFF